MIGFFILQEVPSDEAPLVSAYREGNKDIIGRFYFPPLNRKETSGIAKDTRFFGVLDDITGIGAGLFCEKDFNHKFDYPIQSAGNIQTEKRFVGTAVISPESMLELATNIICTAPETPAATTGNPVKLNLINLEI